MNGSEQQTPRKIQELGSEPERQQKRWLSLFLDGPAGGQFSTDIDRKQNQHERSIWVHRTTRILRLCEPPERCDDYIERIYRPVAIDYERNILYWQLVCNPANKPFLISSLLRSEHMLRR